MTKIAQAPSKPSKSAAVIKLLSRMRGATASELMTATNWQPHSVRAFLSGLRKKGQVLKREARKNGEAAYRLTNGVPVGAAIADALLPTMVSSPPRAREPLLDTPIATPVA